MEAGRGTIPRGEPIALQAGRGQPYKGKKPFMRCDYCHKNGHLKENCFKLIGYPGDFKAKRQVVANNATGVLEHEQQTHMNGEKRASCDQVVGHFFIKDQYRQILNMLNKDTSVPQVNMVGITTSLMANCSNSELIVDCGTTHRIVASLDLLHSKTKLKGEQKEQVQLPTGERTDITHTGSAIILKDLEDLWSGRVREIGKEKKGSVQVNHEPFSADYDFLQQEDLKGIELASTSHLQKVVVPPIMDSIPTHGVDNGPTEEMHNGHFINEHTQGETNTTPSLHDIGARHIVPEVEPALTSEESRRSRRNVKETLWLKDYITQKKANGTTLYPLSDHLTYSKLSTSCQRFIAKISSPTKPQSFAETSKDKRWVEATELEIKALENNKTWEIVNLPKGKNIIGLKWVYQIKFKANGEVERFKDRLVAKGYNQKEGLNYHETFSLVAKMVIVRAVIIVATSKGWNIYQMDVHNAFLQGDLYEEVYMKLPQAFRRQGETKDCKLIKSLHGLKQASRQWNIKLIEALLDACYIQSLYDYSLSKKKK
ncbi:uncharacterized protein LOC142162148 [Nicotiana tabacum]|uniref:Uncharacterized protein LOC142162148 n=1 Tax=Nicotiana tabacum TaxID=4097 RepID=A0AC58RPA6_TOBAC